MRITEENKLDNPVWYALQETHQQFGVIADHVSFYHPDYCPFGGYHKTGNVAEAINAYAELVDNFFVIGEKPAVSHELVIKQELVCDQMIITKVISLPISENIVLLGSEYIAELYKLVNLVQPGYFKPKTAMMGSYYGIFKNDELVAVTGERMQMNGFIEVSAVVTHPGHLGRGYAKQLVAFAVNSIFQKGKIPFLHVIETNAAAIQLYRKLGFDIRSKISFWNITRSSGEYRHSIS